MLLAFSRVETQEDALAFVNEHGPLTSAGRGFKGDPVNDILHEAESIRDVLAAAADQDREALLDNAVLFNYGSLMVRVDPAGQEPHVYLEVPDLRDALRITLANKMGNGAVFRRCPYPPCNQIFEAGEGAHRSLKAAYCDDKHRIQHNSLKRSMEK